MQLANLIHYFYDSGIAPPVEPPALIGGAVDSRMSWRRSRVLLTPIWVNPRIAPIRVTASVHVSLRALAEPPTLGNPVMRGATAAKFRGPLTVVPGFSGGVFRAGAMARLSSFEFLVVQGALKARGEIHIHVRYRGKPFSVAPLLGKPRVWIGPDLVKLDDEELLELLLFME